MHLGISTTAKNVNIYYSDRKIVIVCVNNSKHLQRFNWVKFLFILSALARDLAPAALI